MSIQLRRNAAAKKASITVPIRLAIVGCGPRGLQCLESISRKLTPAQRDSLRIVIYEPAEHPGAGCVYDPRQSGVSRMNFASEHIDLWKTHADAKTSRSDSLIGWLQRRYPQWAGADRYVPRGIVGQYLAECFATVLSRFAAGQVHIIGQRVATVQAVSSVPEGAVGRGPAWRITTQDGVSAQFDQVVITTGHEGLRPHADLAGDSDKSVFALPSHVNLSIDSIPADSRVLIRGFGLTALDAVLELTEGRGGEFSVSPGGEPCYRCGDRQPRRIDVVSRSGRPMLAKPTAAVEPISDAFWSPFRQQLDDRRSDHGSLHFDQDIWSVIIQAAADLLVRGGTAVRPRDVDDWFRGWSRYSMDAGDAVQALRASYQIATGRGGKDVAYALGEAWRKLYPQLVRLISYGGLDDAHWPAFRSTATEMERIAFGPPAASVGKLLAAIDAGIVHLICDPAGDAVSQDDYDHVVQAVIASPGQFERTGPIGSLLRAGHAKLDPNSGGLMIRSDGRPIDSPPGMAVFGRATEGWVLGNDTLTRTMHDQIETWADGLSRQIVSARSNPIEVHSV